MDRVQRTLEPRPADPTRPRDVLAHILFYTQKKELLQKDWVQQIINGTSVQMLRDVEKKFWDLSLTKYGSLEQRTGGYYPFHFTVKKGTEAFQIHSVTLPCITAWGSLSFQSSTGSVYYKMQILLIHKDKGQNTNALFAEHSLLPLLLMVGATAMRTNFYWRFQSGTEL